MKSFEIDNIKNFTARLFAGSDFDAFLVKEAQFSTACTFTIDGHFNSGFLSEEEMKLPENAYGISPWKRLRPICYEIIKGKKVPSQFAIVLMYPPQKIPEFLASGRISHDPQEISGLYLNIRFRQGKLSCTAGCSLKSFSLDRKIETAWDEYMSEYLKRF